MNEEAELEELKAKLRTDVIMDERYGSTLLNMEQQKIRASGKPYSEIVEETLEAERRFTANPEGYRMSRINEVIKKICEDNKTNSNRIKRIKAFRTYLEENTSQYGGIGKSMASSASSSGGLVEKVINLRNRRFGPYKK